MAQRVAHRSHPHALLLALALTGCVSLDYDLSTVPVPVSAKPATPADGEAEPFEVEVRNTLWFHGLFGHSQPDVAALVASVPAEGQRITGFRVQQKSNFHQWLLTHLSLTLVRMRKVVITGELVPE